jgi:hypothetical protein
VDWVGWQARDCFVLAAAACLEVVPIDEKEARLALAVAPIDFDYQRVESHRLADCHSSNKIDLLAASQHRSLDIAP